MKILYVPQLSVDNNGKWDLEADSNWRFMEDLVRGLIKEDQDLEIKLLLPSQTSVKDMRPVHTLMEEDALDYYVQELPHHPFELRFHYNAVAWRRLLELDTYDVIWLNDPCLVMNVRATLTAMGLRHPLIISYNHWIDNDFSKKTPENMSYHWRQVEGAVYSDLHFTNTKFSVDFFLKGAIQLCNLTNYEEVARKTFAIPPPVDSSMRKVVSRTLPFRFAYTQRLSKLPYYRKSLDRFLTAMKEIHEVSPLAVEAWVFNPAKKQLDESLTSLPFVKVVEPNDKQEYLDFLSHCHATVDFYEDERVWSISHNEACALGLMPILKRFDGYKEMYPEEYSGYYNTYEEAVDRMKLAIANPEWREFETNKARTYMLENFNETVVARKVLGLIKEKMK